MVRTVLCFGDSNTHGTPPVPELGASGRYGRATRWPALMAHHLGRAIDHRRYIGEHACILETLQHHFDADAVEITAGNSYTNGLAWFAHALQRRLMSS